MSKTRAVRATQDRKSRLQIHLVDFDTSLAHWLENSVRTARFKAWHHQKVRPAIAAAFARSVVLVELKKPPDLEHRNSESYFSDLLRFYALYLTGSSPLFVAPWLDRSTSWNSLVANLIEHMGATLVGGSTYKERLMDILLPISKKDSSNILTKVMISNRGLEVSFADGKRANLSPREFCRLAEKTEISWNLIRIASSRDYLVVGTPDGEDVPVPSDIIREHVVEAKAERRTENRRLKDTTAASVGERLKRLREKKDLTQEQLAGKAGISRWTVIRLEQGKLLPRVRVLERIARALDTDLVTFLPS